jgi:hypothetical protein
VISCWPLWEEKTQDRGYGQISFANWWRPRTRKWSIRWSVKISHNLEKLSHQKLIVKRVVWWSETRYVIRSCFLSDSPEEKCIISRNSISVMEFEWS